MVAHNGTDIPFKNTIYVLMTVGILIPVFLAHHRMDSVAQPRIGLVANEWAMQLFNLDQPIISLYNIPGMGVHPRSVLRAVRVFHALGRLPHDGSGA